MDGPLTITFWQILFPVQKTTSKNESENNLWWNSVPRQLWEHNAVSQAAKPTAQQLSKPKCHTVAQVHFRAAAVAFGGLPAETAPRFKPTVVMHYFFLTTHRKEKLSSCQLKMLKPDCRDGIIFSKLGKCQRQANKLFFMDASTGNKFTSPRGLSCDWLVLLYLAAFFHLVCACWQGVSRQYIRRGTSLLLHFYS